MKKEHKYLKVFHFADNSDKTMEELLELLDNNWKIISAVSVFDTDGCGNPGKGFVIYILEKNAIYS